MDIPDTAAKVFADMQTAADIGHKQRVQAILEMALAMALKRRLEGKMSTPEWDEMKTAIDKLEAASTATMALVDTVVTQKIDPAEVIASAQRISAVAGAMQAIVAKHTVAQSPNGVGGAGGAGGAGGT